MPFLTEMKKSNKTNLFRLAVTGILSAAALAISFAEKMLIAFLPLPMGIKPGFSNIIVMFTCSSLGLVPALGIAVIKSAFAALMSGTVSGIISLSGGLLSVISMYTVQKLCKDRLSYTGISVISSVMHNAGQLAAASVITSGNLFTAYAPILLVSGTVFGFVTGTILNHTMPYIKKVKIFRIEKFK